MTSKQLEGLDLEGPFICSGQADYLAFGLDKDGHVLLYKARVDNSSNGLANRPTSFCVRSAREGLSRVAFFDALEANDVTLLPGIAHPSFSAPRRTSFEETTFLVKLVDIYNKVYASIPAGDRFPLYGKCFYARGVSFDIAPEDPESRSPTPHPSSDDEDGQPPKKQREMGEPKLGPGCKILTSTELYAAFSSSRPAPINPLTLKLSLTELYGIAPNTSECHYMATRLLEAGRTNPGDVLPLSYYLKLVKGNVIVPKKVEKYTDGSYDKFDK